MKNFLAFIFVLFVFVVSCQNTKEPVSQGTSNQTSGDEKMIVGGYGDQSLDNPDVLLDFELVKPEITKKYPGATNIVLLKAQTQVVAGLNFKLNIGFEADKKPYQAIFVIFHPLDRGDKKITDSQWIEGLQK